MNLEQQYLPDYIAYTKGSCRYGRDRIGVSAYIVLKNKEIMVERFKKLSNTNQHKTELLAMLSAANAIPNGSLMIIRSNNQYCIDLLKGKFEPGNYSDLVEKFMGITEDKTVIFEKISKESSDPYLQRVKCMANSGY